MAVVNSVTGKSIQALIDDNAGLKSVIEMILLSANKLADSTPGDTDDKRVGKLTNLLGYQYTEEGELIVTEQMVEQVARKGGYDVERQGDGTKLLKPITGQ